LKCLGIDPHEILAARVEERTLEAEIDATKMADQSTQRQKLSIIGILGMEKRRNQRTLQKNLEILRVVTTAFRKTAMRPCLIRLSLECFKGQACIWMRAIGQAPLFG